MGDMIPSMVKAIQELSAQVNELKAEIAALKGA
jgi:cell division protein FtsB